MKSQFELQRWKQQNSLLQHNSLLQQNSLFIAIALVITLFSGRCVAQGYGEINHGQTKNAASGEIGKPTLGSETVATYQKIFTGTDFVGWSGAVDAYEISDGVMKCKRKRGGTIFTEKRWSDFSVKFQFRLPPGGNNGLAIRYPGRGDTAYVGMCELQILDDSAEKYANLDARQFHGSAYGIVAAKKGALLAPGKWNSEEVTVVGTTIKVELNGTVILDADLAPFLEPGANFLDAKKHPGLSRKEGHFGFSGHKSAVEFREIYLRDLSAVRDSVDGTK